MSAPRRRAAPPAAGFSLVEILVAVLVLAGLGVAIQSAMVGTLQGVQVDRASEAKRHVCLDLLERFAHPYTDLDSLFGAGPVPDPAVKELSIDQALAAIGLPPAPAAETALLKGTLEAAGVVGFTLYWKKGARLESPDSPATLRLDRLWCFAKVNRQLPGTRGDAFRFFTVRGR